MSRTRVSWAECFLVGILLFGLLGTGCVWIAIAGLILVIREDTNPWALWGPTIVVCALAASSIVGVTAWRLIVRTPDSRPRRGALAGLAVGFLAHPLCWFLLTLILTLRDPAQRDLPLRDTVANLIFMPLLISISSVGIVGWISMPVGAAIGYVARRWTERNQEKGSRSTRAAHG